MSSSSHESGDGASPDTNREGISDEQLPDDVRPGDDNPLAEGPEEDEAGSKDTDETGPASSDLPDVGEPGAS